jgi:hypothetical protein
LSFQAFPEDELISATYRTYMPSYELYLDGLRAGFFSRLRGEEQQEQSKGKRQLQVLLNVERKGIKINLDR